MKSAINSSNCIQLSVIRYDLTLISKKHLFSPRKTTAEGQKINLTLSEIDIRPWCSQFILSRIE